MTRDDLLKLSPHLTDLHMHTLYCDGRDTPRAMVESAIEKGLTTVGVLAHSFVPFDKECRIELDDIPKMKAELLSLRDEYREKINVLFGIEADYYGLHSPDDYDYIIGSVHYLRFGDEYLAIDLSKDLLTDIANEHFGGDFLALCEEYYRLVGDLKEKTGCDIIGHLDLITKFNKDGALFDTRDERYIKAWQRAVDKLLSQGVIFEINTGAMSRGYTDFPYPEGEIIEYIKARGGRFVLSSDAHKSENIAYRFELVGKLL